jgi:type II secretory pathway pseudopilin PulG
MKDPVGAPWSASDGFTILEVTITSSIMIIVLTIILSAMSSLTNADVRAQNLATNQDDLRLAIGSVARDLRSANPFAPADSSGARTVPTGTSLRVALGDTGSAQTYVEWKYDSVSGQLTRSVVASPTGAATSTVVVLRNVSNPGASGVFQYSCLSGAPLDPSAATASVDLPAFTSHIRIVLSSATVAGPAPVAVQQDVQLRNMGVKAC